MLNKSEVEFYNSNGRKFDDLVKVCVNYDLDYSGLLNVLDDLGIKHEYCDPIKQKRRVNILTKIKKGKELYEAGTHSIGDVGIFMSLPKTTTNYFLHLVGTKVRSNGEGLSTTGIRYRDGNLNYSSWIEQFFADRLDELKITYKRQYYVNGANKVADFYLPETNCLIEIDGSISHLKHPEYDEVRNNLYLSLGYNLVILNGSLIAKFGESYGTELAKNLTKFYYPNNTKEFDSKWYSEIWKPESIRKQYSPGGIYYQKLDQSTRFDHSLSYEDIMSYINKFAPRILTAYDLMLKFKCNIHKIQARIRLSAPDDLKDWDRWLVYYLHVKSPLHKHCKIMLEYKSKGERFTIMSLDEIKEYLLSLGRPVKYSDICKLFGCSSRSSNKVKYGLPGIYNITSNDLINIINENYKNN